MAGVLGIYGLIIAVIISNNIVAVVGTSVRRWTPPPSAARQQRRCSSAADAYSAPRHPAQVGYTLYTGFAHLGAGLCCGMSGLAAGVAIGVAGDAGVRAVAKQTKMYVGMVLILIFAEVRSLTACAGGVGSAHTARLYLHAPPLCHRRWASTVSSSHSS